VESTKNQFQLKTYYINKGSFTTSTVKTMARKSVIIALVSTGLRAYFCFRKLIDMENSSSYSTVQCPEYRPESFLNKSFEKPTTDPQSTFSFFTARFKANISERQSSKKLTWSLF
jgi:hypothetical protein